MSTGLFTISQAVNNPNTKNKRTHLYSILLFKNYYLLLIYETHINSKICFRRKVDTGIYYMSSFPRHLRLGRVNTWGRGMGVVKASSSLVTSRGRQHGLRHEECSGVMKTFCIDLGTCNKELTNCLLRSALFKKLDLNHNHLFKKY